MNNKTPKTYGYSINLDERGYFEADVRDSAEKSIWEIDTAGAEDLVRDGFVKNLKDASEIESYLKDIGVLNSDDSLKKLVEAEAVWDEEDFVEINIFAFEGFGNTIHEANLSAPSDEWFTVNDEIDMPDEFYMDFMLTQEMHEEYCAVYVDALRTYLSSKKDIHLPSLKFEYYKQPRNGDYFNGPDVLIAKVKLSEFKALFNQYSSPEDLERKRKTVIDLMSSSDGFASYYQDAAIAAQGSDDIKEWFGSDIEEWDSVELGAILLAITGEIDDNEVLLEVREGISEKASDIVWNRMSEKCRRIVNEFNAVSDGPSP